jgi:hypothetical protein
MLDENIRIATEVEAVLEEANAVVKNMPNPTFFGAETYNTVRQCLSVELALAAARIFDSGRRRSKKNKSDVAGITLCIHFLQQRRCRKVLQSRAREWTPGLMLSSDMNAETCIREIDLAIAGYLSFARSPGGRRALAALKEFRNIKVAHSLFGKILKAAPRYDDLFMLIAIAREFIGHAKLAVSGVQTDYGELSRIKREEAMHFWRKALLAASSGEKFA